MKLTREEKQEIASLIEECIDDALGNVEPEQIKAACEHIRRIVDEYVNLTIAQQEMILS